MMNDSRPSINGIDFEETRRQLYVDIPLRHDQECIRILTLHGGSWTAAIECSLESVDLDDQPSFEALSYCWGPLDPPGEIRVNGHRLHVTPNLYAALQHLRRVEFPRRLWVDAVCINQNSTEQAAQVSIMRHIYSAAEVTIAWVGAADRDSERAFKFCNTDYRRYIQKLKARRLTTGGFQHGKENWPVPDKRSGWGFGGLTGYDGHVMWKVLSRAWFSRAWVLQEAAVSKDVLLQCGSEVTRLDDFLKCHWHCGIVPSNGFTLYTFGTDVSWYERARLFMVLLSNPVAKEQYLQWFPLSSLLSRFRRFDCTKVEDKLFALYGLAQPNVQRAHLSPDYSAPPEKLFIDVTYAMMLFLHDFSVLEVPRGNARLRAHLPTWVPDWTDTTRFGEGLTPDIIYTRTPLDQISELAKWHLKQYNDAREAMVRPEEDAAVAHPPLPFWASYGSRMAQVTKDDSEVLSLEFMLFDDIVETSAKFAHLVGSVWPEELGSDLYRSGPRFGRAHMMARTWVEPFATVDEIADWGMRFQAPEFTYPTGEDQRRAFAHTLCAGTLPVTTGFTPEQWLKYFNRFMGLWIKGRRWRVLGQNIAPPIHPFGANVPPWRERFARRRYRESYDDYRTWGSIARGMLGQVFYLLIFAFFGRPSSLQLLEELATGLAPTYGRRFGLTAKGYFALLLGETEVNDKIAILKGGRLPLILRPKGDTFELIGEAYVHGIMYGEAFDESLCEVIRIC